MSPPWARRTDGVEIHPGDGVVPILKEAGPRSLQIVGTGFYLTRYGLFGTARHVLEELVPSEGKGATRSFVLHRADDNSLHFRRILRVHMHKSADIGVGQADNYLDRFPDNPLWNMRPILCTQLPAPGSPLVTYAYPENRVMDFAVPPQERIIQCGYYEGAFLRYVAETEHPFMDVPYFETTIDVRSGASGGPVFNQSGRIIGVNCRSWEFDGHDEPLSYMVPIERLFELEIDPAGIPRDSWEAAQMPSEAWTRWLSGYGLCLYGHTGLEPPVR